jgi:hypothetical protein
VVSVKLLSMMINIIVLLLRLVHVATTSQSPRYYQQ